MDKKFEFFELLILNNQEKLKEFLNSYGKSPKPICPIMFIKDEESKEEEDNKDGK